MTISDRRGRARAQSLLDRLPLFLVLCGIGAAAMLVPGLYGLVVGEADAAGAFLGAALLFLGLTGIVALAVGRGATGSRARGLLLSLAGAFAVLPAMLAWPLAQAMPGQGYVIAYVEMVSAITTTGASAYPALEQVPQSVHLWRALVGWLGGLMLWVAAIAILAPMRLGGFELMMSDKAVGRDATLGRSRVSERPMQRIWRHTASLAPVYAALTLTLWLALLVAGELPFIALCHAMAMMATSGISPVADLSQTTGGREAEALMALFMVFALARVTFARDMPVPAPRRIWQDPELRSATVLIVAVPAVFFGLHWFGPIETAGTAGALQGLWGSFFIGISFLSTTGFVSADWGAAQDWSGLTRPGLILVGLAMVGGGVATTAGGVKLLRVYALYKQGQLELARLVHPSAVASPGHPSRRIRPDSAYLAWLFFMLFALSVAAVMTALAFVGVAFDQALVLTVAGLANTGPLILVALETPIALAELSMPAQAVYCLAMVLGRLETLALVALLNPVFWRP